MKTVDSGKIVLDSGARALSGVKRVHRVMQNKLKEMSLQIVANRLIDTQIKTEEESMSAYKTLGAGSLG